jgi:hypothetical protein
MRKGVVSLADVVVCKAVRCGKQPVAVILAVPFYIRNLVNGNPARPGFAPSQINPSLYYLCAIKGAFNGFRSVLAGQLAPFAQIKSDCGFLAKVVVKVLAYLQILSE